MAWMYADGITYEDYLVGADENELEASLIRGLLNTDPYDSLVGAEISVQKAALRRIDALKTTGTYETVRQKIHEKVMAANEANLAKLVRANPWAKGMIDRANAELEASGRETDHPLDNLFRGMKSPDPEQRARFIAMYAEQGLADKAYFEARHLLSVLERAKISDRKPKLPTPWTNETEAMSNMRQTKADNPQMTIAEIAKAEDARDPRPSAPNRAKRLARLFSQKMALRN